MPGTYSKLVTVVTGGTITAAERNNEHDNHITNATPAGIDDDSANLAAMQATTDPYPGAVESLATDLSGEFRRTRYLLKQITGQANWYVDPTQDLTTLLPKAGGTMTGGIVFPAEPSPTIANTLYRKGFSKAWVSFDGTTGNIKDGLNATVTRTGAGQYTITWGTDFLAADYALCGMAESPGYVVITSAANLLAGSVQVTVRSDAGAAVDTNYVCVVAFGLQ